MLDFDTRLNALAATGGNLMYGGLKGIEKESLRVAADGSLSSLKHPTGLGSAMTNRYITTDFSEALLEFVTPAFETTWETKRLRITDKWMSFGFGMKKSICTTMGFVSPHRQA